MEGLNYKKIRSIIKDRFLKQCDINDCNCPSCITEENLKALIKIYDRLILDGYIEKNIPNGIKMSISTRMSKSGAKTIYTKYRNRINFEIRVSIRVLTIFSEAKEHKKVCGIDASDMIEALLLIIEHELCHVIEFNTYGDSNCRGKRFKEISSNVFGHTSSFHEILKDSDKKDCNDVIYPKRGQTVSFEYRGKSYRGIVSNINKRATVMVKDFRGAYKDLKGERYTKWYVPLQKLKMEDFIDD